METSWRFFLLSREVEGMTNAHDAVQVAIHSQPFSATDQLDRWLQRAGSAAAATAVFMGHVRPETMDGSPLEALELSHYPGLCERLLLSFTQQQLRDHGVQSALVLHRVGRLSPGELIVLVAVSGDRRGPVQRCCSDLLESLKHEAPFWKREWSGGVGRWLATNTPL